MLSGIFTRVAHFTPDDEGTSKLTGGRLSPSQVRNCKGAGLVPADSDLTSPAQAWIALAEIVGRGKGSHDLAALKWAEMRHGSPRLREVLRRRLLNPEPGETDVTNADALVEHAMTGFLASRFQAGAAAVARGDEFANSPDLPEELEASIAGSAFLPVAQTVVGEYVGEHDLADLHAVVGKLLPNPDTTEPLVSLSETFAVLCLTREIAAGVPAWVNDSPLSKLAQDVATAAEFFDLIAASSMLGHPSSISEDDRWQWIVMLAPAADTLTEIVATVARSLMAAGVRPPSFEELRVFAEELAESHGSANMANSRENLEPGPTPDHES